MDTFDQRMTPEQYKFWLAGFLTACGDTMTAEQLRKLQEVTAKVATSHAPSTLPTPRGPAYAGPATTPVGQPTPWPKIHEMYPDVYFMNQRSYRAGSTYNDGKCKG